MNYNDMKDKADEATALLKAIASPNRLMVLCLLVEGEQSVGALAQSLSVRATVISQHLSLLRRERLVQARREGQTIYYSLRGERVRRLLDTLYSLYCAPEEGVSGPNEPST